MKFILSVVSLSALTLAVQAQGSTSSPLLSDGTLESSALYLPSNFTLKPDNITYNRSGCFDSAPVLNVVFGLLQIPQQMAIADEVPGPLQAYGVHTWTTQFRHSNATTELYKLNDDIYWNLETGHITTVDPVLLLDAEPESAAAKANAQGVQDYDSTDIANNTIKPGVFPSNALNTAAAAGVNGSYGAPVTQFYSSIRTYVPAIQLQLEQPPQTFAIGYTQLLQRIAYYIESVALTANSECAFPSTGTPQLAAIGNYTLAAALASAQANSTKGAFAGGGFVDGQNVDLRYLTSNSTQAAAVCLVQNNDPLTGSGNVYAIEGEIIVDPVNVSDAGACCEACAQQRQNAIGSHSQEADELCNFWTYCPGSERCLFPNGNTTLIPGECALGYAPQLAVNQTWGQPITPPKIGEELIAIAWPTIGIALPTRPDSETDSYGEDLPVYAPVGASEHDTPTGALQYF